MVDLAKGWRLQVDLLVVKRASGETAGMLQRGLLRKRERVGYPEQEVEVSTAKEEFGKKRETDSQPSGSCGPCDLKRRFVNLFVAPCGHQWT